MAHNESMLRKNKEKWGDKVRIVGVSIDDKPEKPHKHCAKEGWTEVEQCHIGGSDAAEIIYQVKNIPYILLVDTKGTIVFAGNPHEREDIEADINALLQEEPLPGS